MMTKVLLKNIVNRSPTIAIVWQLNEGSRVSFVSDGISQFGYSPDDFLNLKLKFSDIIHPDDKDWTTQEAKIKLNSKEVYFEQTHRIFTKSGDIRWIYDWAHIIRNEEGVPQELHGIIQDITDSHLKENKYKILIDTIGVMYLTLDADGLISATNCTSCQILEETEKDLLGLHLIHEFIPQEEKKEIYLLIEKTLKSNTNESIKYQNYIVTRTGKRFKINWSFTIIKDSKGGIQEIIAFGRDVTEIANHQTRLSDISDNIPAAIFQYVLNTDGSESIDYMNAGCEEVWDVSRETIKNDPGVIWSMILDEYREDMKNSVEESAKNLSHWSFEYRIKTPAGKLKWLRATGVPSRLHSGGTLWNSFTFDITDHKLSQEKISQTLRQTVVVLAAALEKRDPYTAGHQENVAKISVLIGEKLGLDSKQLIGLELGAMIHDIGKIAIPSEILSTPNKLLEEEYALIKYHPKNGADLLKGVEFEWPIIEMIMQHHERMDGSGYPLGLVGDEIILEARILAVADTLEAMASHRPYRPALGLEVAADQIRNRAGKFYDVDVAKACLELIDEGKIKL